ncbi:histone-lysine N-methyltransferase SETMAR [Trichonephila clavata]|uniref:Histone-lysine N-methyltransferase SETMAR n=1 Tax=Trichonephila clavata TaxID=2740835 RepID=A0A8X6H0M2_TRICU|nr:histone-lysine N-methyltransferase SETMAR [Trichonephila clavata]
MIAGVNALVLDNRRIKLNEIHRLLGISVGITRTIMHQLFNFRKICLQWVPHHLTEQCHTKTRLALSLSHLQREPESKLQSKLWKRATSPPPRNQKKAVHTNPNKGMCVCDVLHFLPQGPAACRVPGTGNHTINAQSYQATSQNLSRTIKSKCTGMVSMM